jgi:hypothetical protein
MTTFTAVSNSTIYDVCLNTYGTLDLLVKLMTDNNFLGVNIYPVNGQLFVYDETLIANQAIAKTNIIYATK